MTEPKDYLGRPIRAGHVIAFAQRSGNSAKIGVRFVREVHPTHLVCQPGAEEPQDKRCISRIAAFDNCIIIDGEPA